MSAGAAQSFFWNDENLGVVPQAVDGGDGSHTTDPSSSAAALAQAAAPVLMKILEQKGRASGNETLVFVQANDVQGTVHLRFTEAVRGLPVDGAATMMHIRRSDGVVFAVNGEFVNSDELSKQWDDGERLDCATATEQALLESGIQGGVWSSEDPDCDKKAITNDSLGHPHVCWKRSVSYGGIQRDVLYASIVTGKLVARVPTVMTGSGGHGGGFVGERS
jgi:Zn-dependent metalloprotease